MQHETRFLAAQPSGLRMVTEGGLSYLTGYAAVFNSLSEDLGGFRERIMPGAFTRAIAETQDVVLVPDHSREAAKVLGRLRSGTLSLTEDARGLKVRAELPDTQTGRDIREVLRRGDVSGMSFAFSLPSSKAEKWERSGDIVVRTILDVNLFDVSIVLDPAYKATAITVSARSRARAFAEELNGQAASRPSRKAIHRLMLADELERIPRVLTRSYGDCRERS